MNRRRGIFKNGRGLALLLALVLGLGVIAGPALASDHCNITVTPGNNIQTAINDATGGQTICVTAGLYNGNFTINKPLTLQGAQVGVAVSGRTDPGAESTIQGQLTVAADNVEINGFTVTNPGQSNGIVVQPGTSNVDIRNNIVEDIGGANHAANVQAIYLQVEAAGNSNISVINNLIRDVNATRTSGNGTAKAIWIGQSTSNGQSSNVVIQGNTIRNIKSHQTGSTVRWGAYGIQVNNGANSAHTGTTTGLRILDNTIEDLDGHWSHAIGLEGPTPGAVVRGNTIRNVMDHKTPSDAVAVFFEDNPPADTVTVHFNTFENVPVGVAKHPDDAAKWHDSGTPINAANNYWGANSGQSGGVSTPTGCATSGTANGSGSLIGPDVCFAAWLSSAPVVSEVSHNDIVIGPVADFSATYSGTGSPLVILSQFADNPSNVPNFAGASTYFDIFVSGATADDSLEVELPADGAGNLRYYDGSEWLPVLNGGEPISPQGDKYTFTLDNNSTPKLTELDGTPFTGAGNEEIRITPSATTIAAGETFQVLVDAGSDALFGVDVSMTFDTDELEVTGIALGKGAALKGLDADTVAVNTHDNNSGTLRFAYSQRAPKDNVDGGDLVLATITFLAKAHGDTSIALGNVSFTDKDGNPATPAPLDSPIVLTIDPSPSVVATVELQGRTNHSGASLELVPTTTGNVLIDPSSTAAGELAYDPVPAATYNVRIDAAKYLAATKEVTDSPGNEVVNLTTPRLLLLGGDINGDGRINIQDLVIIGANFGTSNAVADINGDGVVNIQDLAIAAGNFGAETSTAYAGW